MAVIRDEVISVVITFTDLNVKQTNLFTPQHHKWLCYIHNTVTNVHRAFSYQCNGRENPAAENALYCVLQDYHAGDMSFEDFCSEFGYDPNPYNYPTKKEFRKTQQVYNATRKNRKRVEDLFTKEQIEHLDKMFEDY